MFLLTIFNYNFLSIAKSKDLYNSSFFFASFTEKNLNYKFKCGAKKIDCNISINKDFIYINKTKIKKNQIKNINNQTICKNQFGFSKCISSNLKNIGFKKITIIYYKKDLLKAKLIFIEDLFKANDFRKNLEIWLGWNSI